MKKRLLMIALCLVLTSTAFGCESSDNGKDKDRSSRTEKDVDDDEDDEDDDSDKKSKKDKKDKKDKDKKEVEDEDKEDEDKKDEDKEDDDKKDKKEVEDEDKDKEDKDDIVVAGGKKSDESLTDNIYDYQISFDGNVISFPISFADFEGYGFSCDDDSTSVPSGSYTMLTFKDADSNRITGYVANFGINSAEAKDCYVVGCQVDKYGYKTGEVKMAGGFALGGGSRDEIEDFFGSPTDYYDSDSYPTVTYSEDFYELVKVTFDYAEGNTIYKIEVKNFVEPEGFDAGEVDTSMPDITAAYVAPKGLSDDLQDYTVDFGGKVYQLPCPVSEFIDDGWEIVADKSAGAISGSSSGKVTLRRDNKEFWTYVTNYDANATIPDYCFVTELEASNYTPTKKADIEIVLSGDIVLGMTTDELEKKLSGYDYEVEESSGSSVYYTVKDSRSLLYYTSIYCSDGVIKSITVQYSPKRADYRKEMGVD